MSEPPPMIQVGPLLGSRYQFEAELGRGGMGVVYGATDRLSGRRVAIKVVHRSLGAAVRGSRDRTRQRERLLMEARAAAAVQHRHVVEVLDVGSEDDDLYLVMERLDGRTLESVLRERGAITPAEALHWLLPIMAALEALHRVGVVHRDIKPSNIFLSHGDGAITPKLLDFGLARAEGDPRVTSSGQVIGTPAYMAPEHAAGEAVGPAADVWSLGIVLYECLAGTTPFPPLDRPALAMQVLLGRVRPLSSACPALPVGFAAAVDRALKRDLAQRYRSMGEMSRALALAARETGMAEVSAAEGPSSAERARSALRGAPTEPQQRVGHVPRREPRPLAAGAPEGAVRSPVRQRSPRGRRALWLVGGLTLFLGGVLSWLLPRAPTDQARAALPPSKGQAAAQVVSPPQVWELRTPPQDASAQLPALPSASRPVIKRQRKRAQADVPAEPTQRPRSRSGVATEWL